MRSSTHRRRGSWVFLILSLLVLGARVTGVHWHLCPDGLEQPESLHWSEPGLSDELEHARASVHDADVCIVADALANPSPPRLVAHAFVAFSFYFRGLTLPQRAFASADSSVSFERVAYFTPQPRGPPA